MMKSAARQAAGESERGGGTCHPGIGFAVERRRVTRLQRADVAAQAAGDDLVPTGG